MKHIKLFLLAVLLLGAQAVSFALPSVEQVEETTAWQQQTQPQNPRVLKAQNAIMLAYSTYQTDVQLNELNETERQIDAIMNATDLTESLEQSIMSIFGEELFNEEMTEDEFAQKLMEKIQDPQTQRKQVQAYAQNKYIKQLIPLFLANQSRYKAEDLDNDTVVMMVAQIVQLQMMQKAMQEAMQGE